MKNFSLFTAVKVLSRKRGHDFFHCEPLWSRCGSTSAPPKFPSMPVPRFSPRDRRWSIRLQLIVRPSARSAGQGKEGRKKRVRKWTKRWGGVGWGEGGGHSLSTGHLCNCHGAACTPMLRSVASGRNWLEWGRTLSLVFLRLWWNNVTSDPFSRIIWNVSG